MIKVQIVNMGALVNLGALPKLITVRAGRNLIDAARAKWIHLAQTQLNSSRLDYIQGIQTPELDGHAYVITLEGKLANMIEHGYDAFQLQETLLGDNTTGWHTAEDGGRYRAIPFRHKTPGSGPVGGQAMGSQFVAQAAQLVGQKAAEQAAFKLGKDIHRRAQRLITAEEKKAGKKGMVALVPGLAPKLKESHTTDIFAGMKVNKQVVAGGKKTQKTYSTFRMISQDAAGNPRPGGKWYHPGIRGRNFAEQVSDYVEQIAPAVVASLTKGLTQ